MKKAFLSSLIILLVPVFLYNCGPSKKEHEKLKGEVEKLRMETEALLVEKQELETAEPFLKTVKIPLESENISIQAKKTELESEADKLILDSEVLLNKAQSLYASKKYEEANAAIATLLNNYPDSKESKASDKLSGKIDLAIEKRKAEIERKKQKAEATKRVSEKRKARAEQKKASINNGAKISIKAETVKKPETVKTAEINAALEKKIEIAHATRHMKTRAGNSEGVKWYHDKNASLYMDSNSFQLYFGMKKGSKPLLRIRVQHQGPDWLFIKSFTVAADWSRFVKDPANFDRDKGNTRTWEWYDASLTDKDIDMINAVISSVKAKVILKGVKDNDEYVITSADKESLRNVLDAYLEVGGEL